MPGAGYRANVEFEETKLLQGQLQEEFGKKIEKASVVRTRGNKNRREEDE